MFTDKNMYRSVSWSRLSDEYFMNSPKGGSSGMRTSLENSDHLPLYNDDTPTKDDPYRKERSRTKFAENAVHVIPFVLLVCALILWLCSNPDVDVANRGDSVAARIEGLTIDGDIDNDSDGTQTGFLPLVDNGDMDGNKQDQKKAVKLRRKLV